MQRSIISLLALAFASGLSAAAMAQTSDTQQTVPQAEQQAQPAQPAETTETVRAPEGIIQMQDQDTFLTSNLVGATIYNAQDEAVGDVNDVIVSRDGKVDGVVVGVGGFLGLGEKDVAIEMSKIKMVDTDTGLKLVFDANRDELAAAPEFKPMEEMQADNQMDATGGEPNTTRGLMVPDEQKTEEQQPQQ
ncbi:MAG TPA: PRC-barrel domain-containing protein [Aestuariivirgaceae bacterium]|jgi:sporulation protein YlmC with PRC-barrel domain